jgi:hypothetical protein
MVQRAACARAAGGGASSPPMSAAASAATRVRIGPPSFSRRGAYRRGRGAGKRAAAALQARTRVGIVVGGKAGGRGRRLAKIQRCPTAATVVAPRDLVARICQELSKISGLC